MGAQNCVGFTMGNGFLILGALEIIYRKCKEKRVGEFFANMVSYKGLGVPEYYFIGD
jgi:hypothetical protein